MSGNDELETVDYSVIQSGKFILTTIIFSSRNHNQESLSELKESSKFTELNNRKVIVVGFLYLRKKFFECSDSIGDFDSIGHLLFIFIGKSVLSPMTRNFGLIP